MADLIVRAGIPELDDCKILTRLKAFLVDQGVCATVEHVIRDRAGNPVNLSAWLASTTSTSISGSSSSSSTTPPAGTVKVRIKEFLGNTVCRSPVWEIYGDGADVAKGTVRIELEPEIVEQAAIYEMNWAICDENGRPVMVDRSILSVERSMFPVDIIHVYKNLGPPTIQEVRMRLMDSSKNENLLLDDVEFKDEQILMAMWEPIRFWNEEPPPIRPTHTTRSFPYRGAWISGVMGQLHLMAANHYRRNVMKSASGGMSDKDKEREYMAEGQRLWQEYVAWVRTKKVEINLGLFAGQSRSQYSSLQGW